MRSAILASLALVASCGEVDPVQAPRPDPPDGSICDEGETAFNGCGTCTCEDWLWSCPAADCGTVDFKAGYEEIDPITYSLRFDQDEATYVSSAARIWYAFQPANDTPEEKPLAVLFNGGPGASTSSLLFSFNTGRMSFDTAFNGGVALGDNPAAWTAFANLLYIDARTTGFSYSLMSDATDPLARHEEFSPRNHNSFLDGADFVRVILRFLGRHPALRDNPVIIAGESYGGIRATVILHLLLSYAEYAGGQLPYQDDALTDEIQQHFEALHPEYEGQDVPPAVIASQFSHQVLIQPLLSGGYESVAKSDMWEQPGSVIHQIAAEEGLTYIPCSVLGGDCHPVVNGLTFVTEQAGRDVYNWAEPANWTTETAEGISTSLLSLENLNTALGVDITTIEWLAPAGRAGAYRIGDPDQLETEVGTVVGSGDLDEAMGSVPDGDAYHIFFNDYVWNAFRGDDVVRFDIWHGGINYGPMFLENVRRVETFVTNAAHDLKVYSPAQPAALAIYAELTGTEHDTAPRADVTRPGWLHLDYQPGAGGGRRTIRFPYYAGSGHAVEMSEPVELRDDIVEWLGAL